MRKRWLQIVVALLIITGIIIGGSLLLKKQNTPDTPAFNHDFTQEFLVEDAETPEGFHLFESGTKKFTILFPENYYMSDGSYYRKKGNKSDTPDMENIYMRHEGISPKENQMTKGINLALHPGGNVIVDSRLEGMLKKINASNETEIKKIEDENKTVYYAENIDDYITEDNDTNRYFYYYGFITHNHSKQALYFELEDTCFHVNEKECEIDFDEEKKIGLEMMKSVKFK